MAPEDADAGISNQRDASCKQDGKKNKERN
jgi:hypothetical protein